MLQRGIAELTKAGNMRNPIWRQLQNGLPLHTTNDVNTIQHSFKKSGITKAMDGSEDDILWESDEQEDAEEVQEDYDDPHEDNLTEAEAIEMFAELPFFSF